MTLYQEPAFPALFRLDEKDLREFDRDLITVLSDQNENLKSILEKGISFDDNIDVSRVTVTSHGTPGMEFSIAHGLGKVPTGYIVYGQAGAGTIYDGTTANTATTLYLRSDAASIAFRIIVF